MAEGNRACPPTPHRRPVTAKNTITTKVTPAAQAVHAVGQVHALTQPTMTKAREHQVHHPVQGERHAEERHVELIGHEPLVAHQRQEQHRRQQLQNELLPGGEPLVLVLADLAVVVHKADQAEHQGEEEDVQMGEDPPPASPPHPRASTVIPVARMNMTPPMVGVPALDLCQVGAVRPDLLARLETCAAPRARNDRLPPSKQS